MLLFIALIGKNASVAVSIIVYSGRWGRAWEGPGGGVDEADEFGATVNLMKDV